MDDAEQRAGNEAERTGRRGRRRRRGDRGADPLALRAFRDAVRDILAVEGRFEVFLATAPAELVGWHGAPARA